MRLAGAWPRPRRVVGGHRHPRGCSALLPPRAVSCRQRLFLGARMSLARRVSGVDSGTRRGPYGNGLRGTEDGKSGSRGSVLPPCPSHATVSPQTRARFLTSRKPLETPPGGLARLPSRRERLQYWACSPGVAKSWLPGSGRFRLL